MRVLTIGLLLLLPFLLGGCGGGGGGEQADETAFDPLPLSVMPDEAMVVVDPSGGIYPVNQLMLRLLNGASRADAEEVARSINAIVLGHLPITGLYQLEVPAQTIAELNQLIESIEQDPRVGAVFQNEYLTPHLPTDLDNLGAQDSALIGAYEVIRIRQAWERINEYQPSVTKVVVGVVDTGVLGSHPEFIGVPGVSSDARPGMVPEWYKNCYPDSWRGYESHGTATAGVIGAGNLAAVASLLPNAPEMNGILSGFMASDYSLAIREFGAFATAVTALESLFPEDRKAEWPAVVNMSFNSRQCGFKDLFEDLFNPSDKCSPCSKKRSFQEHKRAYESLFERYKDTTLFVTGAGNGSASAEKFLPASAEAENLMTVAATTLSDKRAEFSNYGAEVDIAAPGVYVYAPVVSQENSGVAAYASPLNSDSPFKAGCDDGFYCGTSAAAPLVAGVAAMLVAIDPAAPKRPPRLIKEVLKSSAVPIDSGKELLGCSESGGTGCRLDAEMAVCAIIGCKPQVKITVAASVTGGQAVVTWDEKSYLTYNVFISTDPNCDIANYARCDDGRMFPDARSGLILSGLKNGQSYFVTVEAKTSGGVTVTTVVPVFLEKVIFVSEVDGAWDIFSVGLDGSELVNLTETTANDRLPAVSPTLTKIAFVSDRDGQNDIYVMNIDGSDVKRLTNHRLDDAFPVWSPDGSTIAFISQLGSGGATYDIYVMDSDGGNVVRLTDSRRNDTQPHWSPDGDSIVFVSERDGAADIFLMKADGSAQANLTRTSATDTIPFFSPDGSRIAFVSDRDGDFDLWIMDVDGKNLVKLTSDGTDAVGWYSWSPDGRLIAFDSKARGVYDIYVVDPVTGIIRQVTDSTASDRFASWTWYGSKIAYLSDENGTYTINVVDPDGQGIVRLFEGAVDKVYLPAASPVYEEGGGCFIATAAYGSYLEPRVAKLRQFRDDYLLTSSLGKMLVTRYYIWSPPIADVIRQHEALRVITRALLTPIVFGVQYPMQSGLILLVAGFVLVKRSRRESSRMGKQVH